MYQGENPSLFHLIQRRVRRDARNDHRNSGRERESADDQRGDTEHLVQRGTGNKAPGRDGTYMDFFKKNYSTIKDEMLIMFN